MGTSTRFKTITYIDTAVPLRITHPTKLAGEHRVIIESECLGTRLRQHLMRMLTLSGRRAPHAPVGRHRGIAMASSVCGWGKRPGASGVRRCRLLPMLLSVRRDWPRG